jgi:IclR family pca regulon transcriptional regulator
MNKKQTDTDFVEAFARGLRVINAFSLSRLTLTVSEVASATGLARPTTRRLLLTLESLGYVRSANGAYSLTPKVLELGTAYIAAQGLWEIARPHLESLVATTRESSSMSQLDGSDIVYTARVAVPKIIGLSVQIGTRFPAYATSMGRVLLADIPPSEVERIFDIPSQSGIIPRVRPSKRELLASLAEVRKRGWAISDEQLSLGIRSVAAPVRNANGRAIAAVNVTTNAAETSLTELKRLHLPLLLDTAGAISADWIRLEKLPVSNPRPA